jgi:hypothetical protein
LQTCNEYQVPCKPISILILTDDEIDRGLHVKVQSENDESIWGYIFIPPIDLKTTAWGYTFLHELGHCWISIKYQDFITCEITTDLVAICALRKVIPSHKKLYREIIKHCSYIGGEIGKKYFGKTPQNILQDPESYLINLMRESNS